jgi:hypothetical protein
VSKLHSVRGQNRPFHPDGMHRSTDAFGAISQLLLGGATIVVEAP